jgi:membrane protease YdiL (CAAX protease family)
MSEDKRNMVNSSRLSSRWAAIAGLIIVLGSEYILRDAFISKGASGFHIGVVIIVEWAIVLLLVFYWIPKVEHRNMASIGFGKFHWRYIWISIVAYVVYFLILIGVEIGVKSAGLQALRDLSPSLKTYGFSLLFGLFLTGTFVEEIFYRGYIIERVAELTGQRWVAGVVAWLTFTLVHLRFFGLGPTLEVAVFGAIVVILYIRTKNIWPGIIVHGINDIFGFIIGPLFM